MSNEIQQFRERIGQDFDPTLIHPNEYLEEASPCGRYLLSVNTFGTAADPSFPSITVAVVRKVETGEVVATIRRNDSRLFYSWISRDGHDYLLFPEDIEGQSVADLTDRKLAGFSDKDGDLIWTEFHPSPDKLKLAVIGCYWARPYQLAVYDFRHPMQLPLPAILQIDLPANNARFGKWLSDDSLCLIDNQGVVHNIEVPIL